MFYGFGYLKCLALIWDWWFVFGGLFVLLDCLV